MEWVRWVRVQNAWRETFKCTPPQLDFVALVKNQFGRSSYCSAIMNTEFVVDQKVFYDDKVTMSLIEPCRKSQLVGIQVNQTKSRFSFSGSCLSFCACLQYSPLAAAVLEFSLPSVHNTQIRKRANTEYNSLRHFVSLWPLCCHSLANFEDSSTATTIELDNDGIVYSQEHKLQKTFCVFSICTWHDNGGSWCVSELVQVPLALPSSRI